MSKESKQRAQQIAEAARKRDEQTEDTAERRQNLPDLLAAAPEARREKGDEEGARRLEKQLELMRKQLESMEKENKSLSKENELLRVGKGNLAQPGRYSVCTTCGQNAFACKGKHVPMRVMPELLEVTRYFKGVKINHVRYFGNVVVAENMVDAIRAKVNRWEMQQRRELMGRGKIFEDQRVGGRAVSPIA